MSNDRVERFTAAYERCYGAVHAYASRRVGAEAADEITAETFLVAWRRFDQLREEPLPWLYAVARNVLLRHYVTSDREQRMLAGLRSDRTVSSSIGENEANHVLWEAWEQLSVRDREVLALVAWEELSVTEAARALGCSAPVFSVRLHRARRRLEHKLDRAQPSTNPRPLEA